MKEEKKGFVTWVKAHKMELLISGISLSAIIAIIFGIKNKDTLLELWMDLKTSIEKPSTQVRLFTDAVPVSPTVPDIEVEKIPLKEIMDTGRSKQNPFDVREHIRNLHPGWEASPEKKAEAEMLGIILLPGQTLVDAYTKGGMAA